MQIVPESAFPYYWLVLSCFMDHSDDILFSLWLIIAPFHHAVE